MSTLPASHVKSTPAAVWAGQTEQRALQKDGIAHHVAIRFACASTGSDRQRPSHNKSLSACFMCDSSDANPVGKGPSRLQPTPGYHPCVPDGTRQERVMSAEHPTPTIEHSAPTRDPRTAQQRRATLDEIAAEVRTCTRCRLAGSRTNAVPGEGHPDTEVLFVGEGPGFNEDQQGRPFVGAAGKFLTELIESVGWRREEVFITNVVKCRPPGNRDPEPDEIAACAPYLERQIDALDPALVVTLGRFSLQTFMPGARIGHVHGTVRAGASSGGATGPTAYAMYHPAAALRAGALRATLQEDMCGIPGALADARRTRMTAELPPDRPELPDSRPSPQVPPGEVPIDEPPPFAPDPEPHPIPIDDPLVDPEPMPAPMPAGALPEVPPDNDQLSLFA